MSEQRSSAESDDAAIAQQIGAYLGLYSIDTKDVAYIRGVLNVPQTAPMPQNVEAAIKRMKTLADTALPGRAYEEECQAQLRNACVLLEVAYRSQAESAAREYLTLTRPQCATPTSPGASTPARSPRE